MQYKLYIDSVFILQMTTNLYLLSLAGRILRCTATHRRIWLGAAAGAAVSCLFLGLPFFTVGIRLLLGAAPVSMCMMCLAFRIHGWGRLFRACLVMAAVGFFWGGAMLWMLSRLGPLRQGGLFLTLAVGGLVYGLFLLMFKRLTKRDAESLRTVRLFVPGLGQEIQIRALVDTGNRLYDPISGAPVSVISKRMAGAISSCLRQEKYHAIPYRSVGKPCGILPAYELSELVIEEAGRRLKRKRVIVAICDAGISPDGEYQMLLHPRLLED